MEEGRKDTGIQMKYVFITVIGIVSALLLIASIVLLAIGYMNPFGTVGLGILGGGCIAYFSALLFFCASSIWVKNRYFADTTDFGGKQSGASGEDISLLKPASNVTSPTRTEVGFEKETDIPMDNNMVPLYSVSTVYSSISSETTVPDKGLLYNWQEDVDLGGALDSDVFTSSLTATQHNYMKSQERLQPHCGSTEIINIDSTVWDNRDMEKRRKEDLDFNNGKSIADIPRQRKPLVIDAMQLITPVQSCVPHENGKKQLGKNQTDFACKATKENNTRLNTDIFGGGKKPGVPGPATGTPITTAPSKPQHNLADRSKQQNKGGASNQLQMLKSGSLEWEPAPETRNARGAEKGMQTTNGHDSSINSAAQGERQTFQGITSKGLYTVPAATVDPDKKHKSDKTSHERTAMPQQYLPKSHQHQSATALFSNQRIRAQDTSREVTKKPTRPGTRLDY